MGDIFHEQFMVYGAWLMVDENKDSFLVLPRRQPSGVLRFHAPRWPLYASRAFRRPGIGPQDRHQRTVALKIVQRVAHPLFRDMTFNIHEEEVFPGF